MIFHVLLVAIFTWCLLGNISAWWIACIIFILHFSVDNLKRWITAKNHNIRIKKITNNDGFLLLVVDQVLHILTLIILWYCLNKLNITAFQINKWELLLGISYKKGIILLTGLAIGVSGVGIALKYQMFEFTDELNDEIKQGLPKGGKTIGLLERSLVFMFILAGKPEGIGFVLAAKSIFRIGELREKSYRDYAEYIMIGTLKSFTYSLAIAFITKWLIDKV